MSVKTSQGDAELLAATRNGDTAAYYELYQRHVSAAWALVRRLVESVTEIEEVVEETFTRIHHVIERGGGPEQAFRVYLLTALRRTVHDRSGRESRPLPKGQIELFDPGVPFVDPALSGLERSPVARAFLSLPERWQLVLWHIEVEKARLADVAVLLGLTANGVAALAYRAREGARQACLRIHLAETPLPGCRPLRGKMGAHVRGGLAKGESRALDEHMDGCSDCHAVFLELTGMGRSLCAVVGPLIVGPAFVGYLSALGRTGATAGGGLPGWWRRTSRSQQRVIAVGTAATAVLMAASLVLVSTGEPLPPPIVGPGRGVALSEPEPRVLRPSPGTKTKSQENSEAVTPSPAGETRSEGKTGPGRETRSEGKASPGRETRSGGKTGAERKEGSTHMPRLVARIDALGALVRSKAGIVAVRLRNAGEGRSEELVAEVGLPEGVTLPATARRGRVVAAVIPVGTVDGWSCRARARGARCIRGPLAAGRVTAVFLRVLVSATAVEGSPTSVRVSTAGVRVTASSRSGVRAAGASARFATDGRVVTSAIGNTLLSCVPGPLCKAARSREGDRRDNDQWEMRPFDRDGDPSTRSSSAARLLLPSTSKVVWAGLYWSASAPSSGRIKLKVPGDERYREVRATQVVERELPAGRGYQAFADVTRLVGRVRGTYWAADASLRSGVSRYAGWSLVVIAADPRQPYSQAVVLDTATVVDWRGSARIPIEGLTSTATSARVALVTWEGDARLRGDRVTLGGRTLQPDGGDRDPGNPFDGSATGARGTGMTFGTDVDGFRTTLGRDPVLAVSTRRDVLLFGTVVVSVQTGA